MSDGKQLLRDIAGAPDLAALDRLRVAALGKSGSITAQLKSLGSMDAATRAAEAPKVKFSLCLVLYLSWLSELSRESPMITASSLPYFGRLSRKPQASAVQPDVSSLG